MSNIVSWILELKIQDGQFDNFKALMEVMVATTERDEPGALNYEWSISEDKKFCHIYERYEDSTAAMAHLKTFGENEKIAEQFFTVFEPKRLMVYGNPSSEVRDAVVLFGARIMSPIGGFIR